MSDKPSLPELVPLDHASFKELHQGPTSESNWIIPGRVMMSSYPNDLVPQKGKEKIEKLMKAGINCFVCLQTQDELSRFAPYKPHVESYLEENNMDRSSVEFLNLEIPDTYVTSDEALMTFINKELIPRVTNDSCKMLIHCWGGHGRTGTVTACLISHLYKIGSEESLERVAKTHKCRERARGRAPTTQPQFKQVRRLAFGSTGEDEE